MELTKQEVEGIPYEVVENKKEQSMETIIAKLFATRLEEMEAGTYTPTRFRTFDGVYKDFLGFVAQHVDRTNRLPVRAPHNKNIHVMSQVYQVSREKATEAIAERFCDMGATLRVRFPDYSIVTCFYCSGKYGMPAAVIVRNE